MKFQKNKHEFMNNIWAQYIELLGRLRIQKDRIRKILWDKKIIEFLKFLDDLTTFDERYTQCGSNSLHLLVQMKADLREQSSENFRIRNTSLVGGNFLQDADSMDQNLTMQILLNCATVNGRISKYMSQLNQMVIMEVSIWYAILQTVNYQRLVVMIIRFQNGMLNRKNQVQNQGKQRSKISMLLTEYQYISFQKWKFCKQKAKLDGHSDDVFSICYSPDGTTLAFGSWDKSIRLWDVKTGQQKAKLDGHSDSVNSICYSPDGTTLASGR
ncbi:unnamed protein product [Paramecium octaurelia]|uniref:Uncharacterized protein n=1 Tax=Paramecium octaurelia TaxID=43137 RepID=A0A8S1UYR7_PAROT|nr:unnamed protein product [Paramecium octaurelia]